jgi:hypothetical protein
VRTLLLRVAVLALEVVAIVALLAAAAIAIGFAGTFHAGPWAVRMTSPRNPLTIAAVALVIRSLVPHLPLRGLIPASIPGRQAADAWSAAHDRLLTITPQQASVFVFAVMAASLAVKLLLAYRHPGFWIGDDVEIHEMTFAKIFGYTWRPWALRSPVYPLGIIYPVQAVLVGARQTDPARLIFAGRALVATFTVATLWLTFHVARRRFDSPPVAILAVLILATNKLHVATGTTELPRPVASFFVLLAFWLLMTSRRSASAGAAGALIGIAAAMRFSEEIFVLPALIQLALARRWSSGIAFLTGFAIACAIAFGAVDLLYFGEPFFSLRHIVDFTLIRQQSTRGFEPWYEYVRAIPSWTHVAVVAAAVYAAIELRPWTLIAWTAIPVIALSALPHKEPRYLVPMLPYFSMLAAAGLWRSIVLVRHAPRRRQPAALTLAAVVAAVLLTEPMGYLLPRSDDGVAVARYIAAHDATGGVLAEPVWNLGGRLYLPRSDPFVVVDQSLMSERPQFETRIRDRNLVWLVFQDRDVRRLGYERLFADAGFEEVKGLGGSYRVFRRR